MGHEVNINLVSGMNFEVDTGDGVTFQLDSDESVGGQNLGSRPLKLLLASIAGCSGMDVLSILRKKRQDITDFQVKMESEQHTDGHPYVYTAITINFIITGRDVTVAAVERAIELTMTRYCPAVLMMQKAVPIETRYQIIEADAV